MRSFGLLVCVLCVTRQELLAQESMTVEQVTTRAIAHASLSRQLDAEIASERAALDIELTRPNPTWSLTHEQVFGDLNVGYREFSAQLERPLDLTDWRTPLRHALPHQERAIKALWRIRESEIAHEVHLAFYAILYHRRRVAITRDWIARLQTARQGLIEREARGDASSYQVRRVAAEIAIAEVSLDTETSDLEQAWGMLELFLPASPDLTSTARPHLAGELFSREDAPIQPTTALSSDREATPDTLHLHRLRERSLATRQEEAAHQGSSFWRGWTVAAGYRHATVGPSSGHGFILSLSGPLAIEDVQEPRRQHIAARRIRLDAEVDLLTARTRQRIHAARQRLQLAIRAIETHDDTLTDTELTSMAQLAFDTDEAPLSELLDAFEIETRMQLAKVELEREARQAQLALDHILKTGELP